MFTKGRKNAALFHILSMSNQSEGTPLHVAATNFGPPKHHTKYKMISKEDDYSDRVFEVVRDKAELVGKQNALYERSGWGTPLHLAITSNNAFGTWVS